MEISRALARLPKRMKNKSQRPNIIKKEFSPALGVEEERRKSILIVLLRCGRRARCQFWKVYLEIRENLLLSNKLSLFSCLLWCSPFEAETRPDWWRIILASARRSFFLFGTFAPLKVCFASYSSATPNNVSRNFAILARDACCCCEYCQMLSRSRIWALDDEIKWVVHADSGKSINFLQRDIFTTAWDSEMQYGEVRERKKNYFYAKNARKVISSVWTLIAINVETDSKTFAARKPLELSRASPPARTISSWSAVRHRRFTIHHVKRWKQAAAASIAFSLTRLKAFLNVIAKNFSICSVRRHRQQRTINNKTMGQRLRKLI